MRVLTATKRGSVAVAQTLAGAVVGFFLPGAAWDLLGFLPGLVVGGGLTAGGLYLGWQNRQVAFVSGLWPVALISTALMVLIVWGASGMPD